MTFSQVVIVSNLQVIQTIMIPVIKEKGEYLSHKKGWNLSAGVCWYPCHTKLVC